MVKRVRSKVGERKMSLDEKPNESNKNSLQKLKSALEKYDDGTTRVFVKEEYLNGYLVINIQSTGLDNYNWELFHSILIKIIKSEHYQIAFDLSKVKFIADNFFNSVFISFSKLLTKIEGKLILAGWSGMPKDFIEIMKLNKIYCLPTDFEAAVLRSRHIFSYKNLSAKKCEIEGTQDAISEYLISAEKIYNKILPWRDNPWK